MLSIYSIRFVSSKIIRDIINKLYVIMNGSGLIHIYNIDTNGLEFDHSYDTQYSGPRNMIILKIAVNTSKTAQNAPG